MKKSYIKYLVFFIAIFCFGLINVNAKHYCVYGQGEGNSWKKALTLDIDQANPFVVNSSDSPFLTDRIKHGGGGLQIKADEGITSNPGDEHEVHYDYEADVDDKATDVQILYSVKVYNKECPTRINVAALYYGEYSDLSVGDRNNIAFYDDLSEEDAAKFLGFESDSRGKWFQHDRKWDDDDEPVHLNFILEGKKNDPGAKNSCDAYTNYFNDLKDTLKDKNGNIDPKKCDNNSEFDKRYMEIQEICDSFGTSISYAKGDGRAKGCSKACTNLRDDVDDLCQVNHKSSYCGSLGNGIVNWLFKIIRIIRYSLPPLMIILSVLDFIKAISEEDENKMKETTKRFFRRLIAVALLFIVPFIINFILHMFNIPGLNASNPFCAK